MMPQVGEFYRAEMLRYNSHKEELERVYVDLKVIEVDDDGNYVLLSKIDHILSAKNLTPSSLAVGGDFLASPHHKAVLLNIADFPIYNNPNQPRKDAPNQVIKLTKLNGNS